MSFPIRICCPLSSFLSDDVSRRPQVRRGLHNLGVHAGLQSMDYIGKERGPDYNTGPFMATK